MRYIIIGKGNIGKKRKAILADKCVAVVDPFKENVDFPDYKDVPLNSFDAAILATPNSVKVEIIGYLLANKKSALVEKPLLFEDRKIADELSVLAEANGQIWHTSYNHRFEPLVIKLKELLHEDAVGKLYFARLLYGNGTVKNIAGTWRDAGYGTLEDLGCHLLDFKSFLFPENHCGFKINGAGNFEAESVDYCTFSSDDGRLNFMCTTLMWRNTFTIDIFGEKGSLHLNGLRKWGESRLIYHERVFPSGRPKETLFTSSGADLSWDEDIKHFEKMVLLGKTSYSDDVFISETISFLGAALNKVQCAPNGGKFE